MRNLKLTLGVLLVCAMPILFGILLDTDTPSAKSASDNAKSPKTSHLKDNESVDFRDPDWVAYEKAEKNFHADLVTLIRNNRSDLDSISRKYLQLRFLKINRESIRLHYLLETKPERIVRDQGISRFATIDWSDEDQHNIELDHPESGALEKKIRVLRERTIDNDLWKELNAYVRNELRQLPKYEQIKKKHDEQIAKIDKSLGGTKGNDVGDAITPAKSISKLLPSMSQVISSLAVQDKKGRIYFVVREQFTKILYLDPENISKEMNAYELLKTGQVLWTTNAGKDRLELVGIQESGKTNDLLIVFNDGVPFPTSLSAWTYGGTIHSLNINDADAGIKSVSFPTDVVGKVIEKCLANE